MITVERHHEDGSMSDFSISQYGQARRDHAAFLRLEGLKLREIGAHMGISEERARALICGAARRWDHAIRKARFHWQHDHG
jgi:hypothetical protein